MRIRRPLRGPTALLILFTASAAMPFALGADSAAIKAAIAHADRLEGDAARDASRKPLETLTLAGLESGMTVIDLEAGGGYTTELVARTVGADGTVYMQNPPWLTERVGDGIRTRIGGDRLPNVRYSDSAFDALEPGSSTVDVALWIMGPHELWFQPSPDVNFGDPEKAFEEIARILKPGGRFLAIDHRGPADAGPEVGGTTHRASEAVVRYLAQRAGLTLAERSDVLTNAADPLDISVFDPSIRGNTNRFVLVFEKPGG